MTRGSVIAALVLLVAGSVGVGSAIAASARGSGQVQSTQLMIKETERDLVRSRMETGAYPTLLAPAPMDAWGRPLVLEVPADKHPYRLTSYGADGEPGGKGRNADIINWEI